MAFFQTTASSQNIVSDSVQTSIEDSMDSIDISLITCLPHTKVYGLYGHTAMRVTDRTKGMDIVANWGVFDTSKPYFAIRFIFGLTDYMMAVAPTQQFIYEYTMHGSAIREQRLKLTAKEKLAIMQELQRNYLPENRVYRYNFYYDNCTTRARDIILSSIDGNVMTDKTVMQQGSRSMRELIRWKTEPHPWTAFGIDLLLGLMADAESTEKEREFLPEILMADFDSTTIKRSSEVSKLVESSTWIIKENSTETAQSPFFTTPSGVFLLLLFAIIIITMLETIKLKKHIFAIDYAMLFVFGICGIILFAMLFSEHPTVRINLQIFLFTPLWLFLPFIKNKTRKYNVIIVSVILFFLGNFFQHYAAGMNILALCLLIRTISALISLKQKQQK